MREIVLSEKVKDKLCEAIELWADEYLDGKPAILANALYFKLEKAIVESTDEMLKIKW